MAILNCNEEIQLSGENILNVIYPVGSIYLSVSETSPASIYGGSWVKLEEGRTLWTAASEAGKTIAAGLPNIWGYARHVIVCKDNMATAGIFKPSYVTATYWDSNSGGSYQGKQVELNINANTYNDIYGGSETVQPPAIKVYAWQRLD